MVLPQAGAWLTKLSCAAPGWCAAAGTFEEVPSGEDYRQGVFTGVWSGDQWTTTALPTAALGTADKVTISDLDCVSVGSCTGVATFSDWSTEPPTESARPLTLAGGTWAIGEAP
jgi:hypothetical protein